MGCSGSTGPGPEARLPLRRLHAVAGRPAPSRQAWVDARSVAVVAANHHFFQLDRNELERLPHRALWRDFMSIIPESRFDDKRVMQALVNRVARTRERLGGDGIQVTLLQRWSGRVIHPFVTLVDPPPVNITDEYVSDLMASATKTVAQRRAMRARPDGRCVPSSCYLAVLADVVMLVPPLHDPSAVVSLPASSDPMTLSALPLASRSVTLLDAYESWQDVPLPLANQGSKKRHWLWEALALIQGVLHSSPDARGACTN